MSFRPQADPSTHPISEAPRSGPTKFPGGSPHERSILKRLRKPEESLPKSSPRLSLLIVEDDRDFCYDLFDYFETLGLDVTGTHDERTAGHLLRTGNFDVVILDLDMPYQLGLKLIEDARQRQSDLRSILLTERRIDSQLVTRARAAGCLKLFSKPIDCRTVHHVVTAGCGPQHEPDQSSHQ